MAAADAPRETRASRALRKKFDSKWGEQAKCSERTRIHAVRLSRIADGKAICRADEASRLVEEGIPSHWWDEDPLEEEPALDPEHPANTSEPAA